MAAKESSGRIDYPVEGYTVAWGPGGLDIRVTDYHAGVLSIPWATILDLAQKANATREDQWESPDLEE